VLLTLEESLASILLEEGFMSDRSGQIINHELEDWFNFFFVVSRVVGQGSILLLLVKLNVYGEV